MEFVRMSKKGQLVIPASIRKMLKLRLGDKFIAYGKEDYIVFKKIELPSLRKEFEEIAANITLAALPDAIYKAYQNVLPKENREFIPVLEDETIVEPQTILNL